MATFHFDLVSPEKLLFSGEVDQVDVPGAEGDFGVLAGHAPTVSALRPGIMTVFAGGKAAHGRARRLRGSLGRRQADRARRPRRNSVEDFDRAVLSERIAAQEEKIKEMEGSALDKAIERLDHFKQIDQHLQARRCIDAALWRDATYSRSLRPWRGRSWINREPANSFVTADRPRAGTAPRAPPRASRSQRHARTPAPDRCACPRP